MKLLTFLFLALPLCASPILVSGSGSFGCDPEGSDYSVSFSGSGVALVANSIYALGCVFPSPILSGFVDGAGSASIQRFTSDRFGFNFGEGTGSLVLFDDSGPIAQVELSAYLDVTLLGANPAYRESYGTFTVGDHPEHGQVPEPGSWGLGILGLGSLLMRRGLVNHGWFHSVL